MINERDKLLFKLKYSTVQLSPIFGLFYTEIFNEHDKIFNYNPEICAV